MKKFIPVLLAMVMIVSASFFFAQPVRADEKGDLIAQLQIEVDYLGDRIRGLKMIREGYLLEIQSMAKEKKIADEEIKSTINRATKRKIGAVNRLSRKIIGLERREKIARATLKVLGAN